ncbi:MAG TPA: NAD(P)/FAD-dependent oxidoreductase [Ilumatobacteraceae bacterium]|nr:NAD(P)/FAD-dependent oxidoreductase [Ilumatobacteraceae bacterium]
MTGIRYDVAIVGGGVVGCALAHELSRWQVRTVLLERATEVGFGTSKANSGIIHGGHQAAPGTLKGRLEWEGNQLWDGLCAELGFGFARIGALTVALSDDDVPALDKLEHHARDKGVPGVQRWGRRKVLAAEPHLSRDVVAALYAPTTAVINPYEACFGLAEHAAAAGVEVRTDCPVTALTADAEGWVLTTPTGALHARFVLNAAGVHAADIARRAGLPGFRIRARKGEEYLLDKRLRGLVQRVIYPCPSPTSKGTLVTPTYDGTIMIGPTADEVDDPDDTTTTLDGAARVLAAAQRLVPGISERDVIAEFAGVRAVLDDEDFRIGPTDAPGLFDVAGIQSPGLTAAPAIALMVVQQLREAGLSLVPRPAGDRSPFERPVRFAALASDAQQRLAAEDPAYARLVCRCELVTEAEIHRAIQHGARTLDGLKFRTRAGMGRCQGGFCTSRCMEQLARELHVPLSAITKRGDGSWLVLDRDDVVEVNQP